MKIGILTFHLPTNFGANLQAFASSRYFSSMGHEVRVLNYARPADLENRIKTTEIQLKAHRKFVEERLSLSKMVTTAVELCTLVKEEGIELLVIGADAVWRLLDDEYIFFAKWLFDDLSLAHIPVVSMSAAHMGDGFASLGEKQRKTLADCLRKFRYLTVRDEWTRHVVNRDLFEGKSVVELINPDPVFILSLGEEERWESYGEQPKGYVVVTLPKNWTAGRRQGLEHKLWFLRLKRCVHRRGLRLIELPLPEGPSGLTFDFTVPYPIDPVQWFLWLRNAKCFIGLRFHAVVSCIASGTPFFSFDSYDRNNHPERSKIYHLLKDTPFEKYRSNSLPDVSPVKLMKALDNVSSEDVLRFRDVQRQLFELNMKQMFATIDGRMRKIENLGDDCTSCFACYNVCSKQAISMAEDNEGFYTPRVDYGKCVGCGLCDDTCPQLNAHELVRTLKAWYGYQKSDSERMTASSGGMFGALAEQVLRQGGVVYGAAFNNGDDTLRLECRSTDEIPLAALKKSKYVQSYVGNAFQRVKHDLEQGRQVLFCGTPCQVDGLRRVLRKDDERLLTVDFVCHGVPPMALLRDHLRMLGIENPDDIDFRPKHHAWVDDFVIRDSKRHYKYSIPWENDAYFYGFEKSLNTHSSCGHCRYCNGLRAADVTLADFWGYKAFDESIYTPKGISLLMANTPCGIAAVETLDDTCMVKAIDSKYSEYVYARLRGGKTIGYYDMDKRYTFFAEIRLYGYAKAIKRMGLQKKPDRGLLHRLGHKLKNVAKLLPKR